jgi:dCMP deaminase
MKDKFVRAHMRVAEVYADLSSAVKRKVGCVIVKDDRIISIGYNGMPAGWDNTCENSSGETKPEVLHSETNAISKLAAGSGEGSGAALFCTCAPCLECAKLIFQSGIVEVYYRDDYKNRDGLFFLSKCGVRVTKVNNDW